MKYKIHWMDATDLDHYYTEQELTDNVFVENEELLRRLTQSLMEDGIQMVSSEIHGDYDGGYVDYGAIHEFEVGSDDEAKQYVKKYDFGGRDQEVFTVTNEDGFYWTEEDWDCEARGEVVVNSKEKNEAKDEAYYKLGL